jgi:hypothetical protein
MGSGRIYVRGMQLASHGLTEERGKDMTPATKLLPRGERRNFGVTPPNNDHVLNFSDMRNDPDFKRRIAEGRKSSFHKPDYLGAIRAKCRECFQDPGDCKAGDECRLYSIRHKPTTPIAQIRASVRAECIDCVGTTEDICASPGCQLYPMRFGRKKRQGMTRTERKRN